MISINESNYKNIKIITDLISSKSGIQRKKIDAFILKRNQEELEYIESSLEKYSSYLEHADISIDHAVNYYLKMVTDMVRSQIYFMKTGKYPMNNSIDAFNSVYNNPDEMTSYMIGLAISQFFWESHFQMFLTFREAIELNKDSVKTYLEIGPGHGLFFLEAIRVLADRASFDAVDISRVSMGITKSIVSHFSGDSVNPHYLVSDMLDLDRDKKYDFITMGEVLEHVNDPGRLLRKLHELLADTGKAYISTCVNCPTIDHVYHFKCIEEIFDILKNNGFEIINHKILPTEDLPMQEIIERKIAINYCAIIKRA